MVKIKGYYRARWTQEGARIYGPQRKKREQADQDRIKGPPPKKVEAPVHSKPISSAQTLTGDWVFECMAGGYGKGLADPSFETNEGHRVNHIEGTALAEMPLGLVRPSHVQEWVNDLKPMEWDAESKQWAKSARPMSPATIRRVYAVLSKAFSLAVRDGLIDYSPCRQIILPAVKERRNRVLTTKESSLVLQPGTMLDVAIILGHHGMSRKEILGLEWHHVNFEAKEIHVPGTKNIHRDRVIPMSSWVARALSILDRSTVRVIVNSAGNPFDPKKFSKVAKARMVAIGLPQETRFQDLRGTFITQALEMGVNIKTVMDIVGHSNVQTTTRSYARPRMEVGVDAMKKMEQMAAKSGKKSNRVT